MQKYPDGLGRLTVKYDWPPEMPEKARAAFAAHVRNARRRGIPFLFTPGEWWAWWSVEDRWSKRGVGANDLCMARVGDQGPYSPSNVRCITQNENKKEVSPETILAAAEKRSRAFAANPRPAPPGAGKHLAVRGDGHPRSRAVITPHGRYGSGELAAEAYGISPATARERARKQLIGWRFEDEPERPEVAPVGKPKIRRRIRKTKPLAQTRTKP